MGQRALYDPTRLWLESKGFRALITGHKKNFVIPTSDLFAGPYKIPDLVGIDRDDRVVIVEVETRKERFFDALGRCMLWRSMATFAYLVYPKGEVSRAAFLNRIAVGLLEVDIASHAVTELIALPQEGGNLRGVWEIHPTDFAREQQLAALIRGSIG
jgi:hypothetical protein